MNPNDLEDIALINSREIVPGRFELFREGEEKILCVYNQGVGSWLRVGTLSSSPSSANEKVVAPDGKVYDTCIDVSMDDGRTFPLYCNYHDNEFIVARDFLTQYQLPMLYLEQTAKFIQQHRKPHQLSTAKAGPVADTSFFVNAYPIYNDSIDIGAAIKKFRSLNPPTFTESDYQNLQNWPSQNYFSLLKKAIFNCEPSISWPVIEILRYVIYQPNSNLYVKANELKECVQHLIQFAILDDLAIWAITRLISNLTQNYVSIVKELKLGEFLTNNASSFSGFHNRTQLSYTGAILNLTLISSMNLALLQHLTVSLCNILCYPMDDFALDRAITAAGIIAITDPTLKKKFSDLKDFIAQQYNPSGDTFEVFQSFLLLI